MLLVFLNWTPPGIPLNGIHPPGIRLCSPLSTAPQGLLGHLTSLDLLPLRCVARIWFCVKMGRGVITQYYSPISPPRAFLWSCCSKVTQSFAKCR